jgi:hypothetical protein
MSKEMRQYIDKFNKFRITESENLNISDVSFSDLKNYCKYLIDEYEKIKSGEGGRVMSDLIQFYEDGLNKKLTYTPCYV